jgi:hypothetical protein
LIHKSAPKTPPAEKHDTPLPSAINTYTPFALNKEFVKVSRRKARQVS